LNIEIHEQKFKYIQLENTDGEEYTGNRLQISLFIHLNAVEFLKYIGSLKGLDANMYPAIILTGSNKRKAALHHASNCSFSNWFTAK